MVEAGWPASRASASGEGGMWTCAKVPPAGRAGRRRVYEVRLTGKVSF